jgi:serine/threonine protein kinase/ABC-type dipeptide/oligopeptide/nickel transport system permease subunit
VDSWIGQQLGPYELQSKLGAGGMGVVYRAVHKRLGQARAIKVLPAMLAHDETFLQRFEREARLASELRHPNIVMIHDIAEENSTQYIVMELLEGRSLHDVIRRDGPLPIERAVSLLGQLADALDFAHAGGVVHRDIKPGNAIVDASDHLTLVDFGIARAAEGTRLTEASTRIGTAEYMAPETITEGESGPGTDLYALGVIAYEMLTGRVPFTGVNSQTIMYAQIHTQPPLPRTIRADLSPAIEWVVLKQLQKSPAERFPTGRAFVEAIQAAAGGMTGTALLPNVGAPETAMPPGPGSRPVSGLTSGAASQRGSGFGGAPAAAPAATPPPHPTAAPDSQQAAVQTGPRQTPVSGTRAFLPPPPTVPGLNPEVVVSPVASGIHRVLEQARPSTFTLYKLTFGALVAVLLLMAFLPTPRDPLATNVQARLIYPLGLAGNYPLGGDTDGRDVLSRLMIGGRFEVLRLGLLGALVAGVGFLARRQLSKRMRRAWPRTPLIVIAIGVTLAAALLVETGIGLLGTNTTLRWLGIVGRLLVGAPADASSASWSGMLIEGREAGIRAPWLFLFPFLCLVGSALGLLALASAVADLLKRRAPAPTAILSPEEAAGLPRR